MVSVIMPMHNAERYLGAAIESIQMQSHTDWELLCLDDGSADGSANLAESYARSDGRIRCVRFAKRGIVPTMNDGISMSSGQWVARMDADDLSRPDRFRTQLDFLKSRPEIAVVGTGCQIIDPAGRIQKEKRYCCDPEEIRRELLQRNCICHPTVMMRREALMEMKGPYRSAFHFAEDYDLWLRMSRQHPMANLSQPLLQYRVDASRISSERVITETLSCVAARLESRTVQRLVAASRNPQTPFDRSALIDAGLSRRRVDFLLRRSLLLAARRAHRGGFRSVSLELIDKAGQFLRPDTPLSEQFGFYIRTLPLKWAC